MAVAGWLLQHAFFAVRPAAHDRVCGTFALQRRRFFFLLFCARLFTPLVQHHVRILLLRHIGVCLAARG